MRLALDPRTRRLLRRVPHTNVYSAMELLLLSLLALQCARLFWTLLTPVGPVGEWRVATAIQPAPTASAELLGSFDPFFRTTGDAGPAVVTSLDLKLFGIRQDHASGRGSAIIGTADGQQKSFVVGDEIMPGVTLQGVDFDYVTISRNGVAEQIYMDQSAPATSVSPPPVSSPAPPSMPSAAPPSAPASSTIGNGQ